MPAHFDLIITADYANRVAEFRLLDEHGAQVAFRQTDFKAVSVSHLNGLFNLRNFLGLYVEESEQVSAVAEIGVCIAEKVLGVEIFGILWQPRSQRTLCIQLPGATEEENHLAAALARVPWEIARPSSDQPTLGERNLIVRVVHDMQAPVSQPMALGPDESLRVLFVFAEARGSQPLGARQERRELLRMLEKEVYPERRVVAHFLTHGVTRERLKDQILENNGYHIVHWSGHGGLNLLELAKPGGAMDHLSGEQLLDIFTKAGGFLPRLFFLSACHSGDILGVRDWNDFIAIARGKEPDARDVGTRTFEIEEPLGFTGTAHSLLQVGVPSVVAMRFAVGDDYARELAVEFYRTLLAHAQPKTVAVALTMARQSLLDANKHEQSRFAVCDHATPVLYGEEQPGLTIASGRSPGLNPRDRRLHQIAELTQVNHEHFVGRTWELAGLGADFIGSKASTKVNPVAVITGLGGMGKTALVAEALSLWETRFEWVLLYQAKPNALGFEATLRDIHMKLNGEVKHYHSHVRANPADAIYRDPNESFTGPERMARLTRNLLRAMKHEPILIVLDNFETNLKPQTDSSVASCQDPDWDRCLTLLATDLMGTPSRVLITCRRPLAALGGGAGFPVLLGPLPAAEAALYLRAHPALSHMVFGADAAENALAERLLNASRFHPLLMDRLARLAADPLLRGQLLQALDTLEHTKEFSQLPALFATERRDAKELAYLEDALATSLDQLIAGTSPDARRLLWVIAVANDPVERGLLESVWSGEDSPQQAQLRQIKKMLDDMPQLSPKQQEELKAMPPEVHALLDALPLEPVCRPDPEPLLHQLVSVGLALEERSSPDDANPDLTCHELVRERIRAWMEQAPQDRGEFTENVIRLTYADQLEANFWSLIYNDVTAALQVGCRALIYCVQANALVRLSSFASLIVTSTNNLQLLAHLIPHLQTAAESSPEGRMRWRCLSYLADALMECGPDASLPFYAEAARLARAAAELGDEGLWPGWGDLAAITGNWSSALLQCGHLDSARQRRIEAIEANLRAGSPPMEIIKGELELLRIDIRQGRLTTARPRIEMLLAKLQLQSHAYRSGQCELEVEDAEDLARALICAIDIALDSDFAQRDWESALRRATDLLEEAKALGRADSQMAPIRTRRADVLKELRRFDEAQAEFDACIPFFQNDPRRAARTIGSLADVFYRQGDVAQAITQGRRALSRLEHFPDPEDRAISHGNLAIYLEREGTSPARIESRKHLFAALMYFHVADIYRHVQTAIGNYAIAFRNARAAGTQLVVPRVAQLLADPAFAALEQWLRQRGVDIDELQADLDKFIDQARQASADS
jgi:tetratricopeptide (TPR) repeat protein